MEAGIKVEVILKRKIKLSQLTSQQKFRSWLDLEPLFCHVAKSPGSIRIIIYLKNEALNLHKCTKFSKNDYEQWSKLLKTIMSG